MLRIIFLSKSARNLFFDKVLFYYKYKNWVELYKKLDIPRSVFDKYRHGELTLPLELYNKMASLFDNKTKSYFLINIKSVDSNWGQREGGKSAYIINKEVFNKGIIKGLIKIREKINNGMSKKFDINLNLDNNLSYFIGLFIGDGFSNKYGKYHLTQFVGNKKEEYYFYNDLICPYINQTFNVRPQIKEFVGANYIRINIYSKDLFLMITERFNIAAGKKSYTVLIPEIIVKSSSETLLSCIAGIYDAEGCIFWDKRKKYLQPYPRIDLHMINPSIIKQINDILVKEGIKTSISGNYERILIYGKKNISDFLKKVPIKNPKHLSKLGEITTGSAK